MGKLCVKRENYALSYETVFVVRVNFSSHGKINNNEI